MTPWIDVKNGLPPQEEKEYLVTDGINVAIYLWKYWRRCGYENEWIWCDYDRDEFEVKWWQPLPKPPGEK